MGTGTDPPVQAMVCGEYRVIVCADVKSVYENILQLFQSPLNTIETVR